MLRVRANGMKYVARDKLTTGTRFLKVEQQLISLLAAKIGIFPVEK